MALSGWDYNKRIKFVIAPGDVPSAQTDFPALLNICSATGLTDHDLSAFFTELGSSGSLKVAAEVGYSGVETYVEIERYSSADLSAQYHVLIPTVSDSDYTVINFYYDSEKSDNTTYVGTIGSTPGQAVWANDYLYVYHLSQSPAGDLEDSLATVDGVTVNMDSSDLVSAFIGKGIETNGSDEHATFTFPANLTTATVEISVKATDTVAENDGIFSGYSNINNYAIALVVKSSTSAKLYVGNSLESSALTVTNWTDWNHFAYTLNSSEYKLRNMVAATNISDSTDRNYFIPSASAIGRWYNDDRRFPGVYRGLYISSVVRSEDWLELSYLSRTDSLFTVEISQGLLIDPLEEAYSEGIVGILGIGDLNDYFETSAATSTENRWGGVSASDKLEQCDAEGTATIISWGYLQDPKDQAEIVSYWSRGFCNDGLDTVSCSGDVITVGTGNLIDGIERISAYGFCSNLSSVSIIDPMEKARAKGKNVLASAPIKYDKFRRCHRLDLTSYGRISAYDPLEQANIT